MTSVTRLACTSRYSKLVVRDDTVYLAGLIANDADADITQQTRDIFDQIDALLARAGAGKSQLLTMNVWIKDFADYAAFNAAYDGWIDPSNLPARATVRADLLDPRLRVEIMCTASRSAGLPISLTSDELLARAKSQVRTLPVAEALRHFEQGAAEFIDVRDAGERAQKGAIPGSTHAARGMLEFHMDAASSFALPVFLSNKPLIFVCGSGGRATLAAATAKSMGINALVLEGGMRAWLQAGGSASVPA